ncbi:hypothetical protein ACA910_014717 [Epithemia clementina (nom. ined.)]
MPKKSKVLLEQILRHGRKSPQDIRTLLDEEARRRHGSPPGPFTIKGVYKGQYYRIRVPPAPEKKRRFLPDIPKLPQTHMAKPKTFTKLPPPGSGSSSTTGKSGATASSSSSSSHTASASGTSSATAAAAADSAATSTKTTTALREKLQEKREKVHDFASRFREWWRDNWAVLVLNIGSICSLVGFTRSDVVELRTLSTAGSVTSLIYHFSLSPRRMAPIAWSMIFAAVNSWKIYQVISEREGTVNFTKEQEQVYSKFFMPHGVTPKQFEHIYQQAEIVLVKKGQVVVHERQEMTHVCLVINGETRAQALGRRLTAASFKVVDDAVDATDDDRLSWTSGAWIGEMAFLESYWKKQASPSANSSSNGTHVKASSSSSSSATASHESQQSPQSQQSAQQSQSTINKPKLSKQQEQQQQQTTTVVSSSTNEPKHDSALRNAPLYSTTAAMTTPESVVASYQHPETSPLIAGAAAAANVPVPRRVLSRRRTNALQRSSAMSSKQALYTIVAVQDSVLMRWKYEDMERLLAKSPDLRGAMTRAMTAAIVGKVINFTVSRRASRPQNWTNWLRDWTPTNDGAKVQVQKDVSSNNAVASAAAKVVVDEESPPGGPIKNFGGV